MLVISQRVHHDIQEDRAGDMPAGRMPQWIVTHCWRSKCLKTALAAYDPVMGLVLFLEFFH